MTTTTALPTKMRPAIYEEISVTSGDDPYGWATGWAFAIADCLYDRWEVPAHWHYSPGNTPPRISHMARNVDSEFSYEQEVIATLVTNREVDADDLIYAGDVLMRSIRLVTILGHSY